MNEMMYILMQLLAKYAAAAFGGCDEMLGALLVLMVVEPAVQFINRRRQPVQIDLVKKMNNLLLVIVSVQVDGLISNLGITHPFVRTGVIVFFCVAELTSIMRYSNSVPPVLRQAVDKLKELTNKKG